MSDMEKWLILVAGGSGRRMGSDRPKQFLSINGKPIILHTLEKFLSAIPRIKVVVVVHSPSINELEDIISIQGYSNHIQLVKGGQNRFASVLQGLKAAPTGENVLIGVHDAVRPCLSHKLIESAYAQGLTYGSAVPVISVKDSLRQLTARGSKGVDRSKYLSVQTPQCFKASPLQKAYAQQYHTSYTDSATVMESLGIKIHTIPGEVMNIKITTPIDLKLAEWILSNNP